MISQDLDAVTILDKFVREHPDFSPYGAKGCLSLTGYCGILGYRTMTEKEDTSAAHEENRGIGGEACDHTADLRAGHRRYGYQWQADTWQSLQCG